MNEAETKTYEALLEKVVLYAEYGSLSKEALNTLKSFMVTMDEKYTKVDEVEKKFPTKQDPPYKNPVMEAPSPPTDIKAPIAPEIFPSPSVESIREYSDKVDKAYRNMYCIDTIAPYTPTIPDLEKSYGELDGLEFKAATAAHKITPPKPSHPDGYYGEFDGAMFKF